MAEKMKCIRCNTEQNFAGSKRFREGENWGVFGDLGELFENSEVFDVYFCPKCGHVEMFVDGVGEELRTRE